MDPPTCKVGTPNTALPDLDSCLIILVVGVGEVDVVKRISESAVVALVVLTSMPQAVVPFVRLK